MTVLGSASSGTASLKNMEAAKRWETEAIRDARERRRSRPAVSQDRTSKPSDGEWATLREAADATGIPINTLRKWCRRDSVTSYLESDGELTLRIVEMASVRRHAEDLGRNLAPRAERPDVESEPETEHGAPSTGYEPPTTDDQPPTMIVPVDAWNKMLNQLGNLHEAGQQLAEARERAAKAETEARFLRERLAELRATPTPAPAEAGAPPPPVPAAPTPPQPAGKVDAPEPTGDPVDAPEKPSGTDTDQPATTSFFRYVVRGWRGRKR